MSWNGSGLFSRVYGSTGWTGDRNAGTKIVSGRHDTHDQDLSDGINSCLAKNGENGATGDIHPNVDGGVSLGTATKRWLNLLVSGTLQLFSGVYKITVAPATLTADRAVTVPDAAGTVSLVANTETLTNKTMGPESASAGNGGVIRLAELAANGVHVTGWRAPDSLAADVLYTMPSADGTNGYGLTTNGSGTLAWSPPNTSFAPIGASAGDGGRIYLLELAANGVHSVAVAAPDSIAASFKITLPNAVPTIAGAGMTFTTAGVASFSTSPMATESYADTSQADAEGTAIALQMIGMF